MAVGAVLALAGALLVVVVLLRPSRPAQPIQFGQPGQPGQPGSPGRSDQNRTLTVVAGLVLAALGAVTLSAGILADDEDGDDTETSGTPPSSVAGDETTASDGDGTEGTDPERTDESSPDVTRSELPDCFEQHLARDPVVQADDHVRLVEGVNVPVSPTLPTALELADGDEVLGVMRVVHEALDDYVHIYDVVDARCTAVSFEPQSALDEVERTTRTTVPLRLADRNYELTFDGVEHGQTFDTTLRHTG